jgi:hypothetical protein
VRQARFAARIEPDVFQQLLFDLLLIGLNSGFSVFWG